MQKIETMFPLQQRVKLLVRPSKDKDGVVKQDWDVYIGHELNNKLGFGEIQMVQSILHAQIICKDL